MDISKEEVRTLIRLVYFLTSKGIAVRGGEERDVIAYRVPVREFERLKAKSDMLQGVLDDL